MLSLVTWCVEHHTCVITTQIGDELARVTRRKSPSQMGVVSEFLFHPGIQIVDIDSSLTNVKTRIRDETDQPILDAAIAEDVDVILTGDRDFLALSLKRPLVISPAEFYAAFMAEND